MLLAFFEIWGCLHELNSRYIMSQRHIKCVQHLGWFDSRLDTRWCNNLVVYYRQKKIAEKQDRVLAHMVKLEQKMIDMERRIMEKILSLDKKFESSPEKSK